MPSFRNSKEKASHAVRSKVAHGSARHGNKTDGKIHSVGTERNYTQALKQVQEWLSSNKMGDLKGLSKGVAIKYITERSNIVVQKTLDLDRQALQTILGSKIDRIQSSLAPGRLGTETRSYSHDQVKAIIDNQNERHALATEVAHAAGLRAHELLTLLPANERPASCHRQWSSNRFEGR